MLKRLRKERKRNAEKRQQLCDTIHEFHRCKLKYNGRGTTLLQIPYRTAYLRVEYGIKHKKSITDILVK